MRLPERMGSGRKYSSLAIDQTKIKSVVVSKV
jgi:hypothetical protein